MTSFILLDASFSAAIVGGISGLFVAATTIMTKRVIETSVLSSKLQTKHNFEQRKRIMEVLSKYKVQLLNSCEDLSHRLNNFDGHENYEEMEMDGDYVKEDYYFHSFVYRVLSVFGWIKKIECEMIFLDTTLASKKDLDFIKFLRLFPRVFCNLSVIGSRESNYKSQESFTRNKFDILADCIVVESGIKSYANFINELTHVQKDLKSLFQFLDGVKPEEKMRRWHRLKLLHTVLIVFLNCYGYDFQKTDDTKARKMLCRPFPSKYTKNYPKFFAKYHLDECPEVQQLLRLVNAFHDDTKIFPARSQRKGEELQPDSCPELQNSEGLAGHTGNRIVDLIPELKDQEQDHWLYRLKKRVWRVGRVRRHATGNGFSRTYESNNEIV